jgi:hypothetical protein
MSKKNTLVLGGVMGETLSTHSSSGFGFSKAVRPCANKFSTSAFYCCRNTFGRLAAVATAETPGLALLVLFLTIIIEQT